MKKITFFMTGLSPSGGVRVLFEVGNRLLTRGFEVEYLVAEPPKKLPFPSNCRFMFSPKKIQGVFNKIYWLSKYRVVSDVAIATFHPTAYAVALNRSGFTSKLYYIQAYETGFYNTSIKLMRWYLVLYLLSKYSYFLPLTQIVNCEGSKKGLPLKKKNIAVEIPPGIDPNIFYPKKRSNKKLAIGHISREAQWKGSANFFEAMNLLREEGYDFEVVVAYDLCKETFGLDYKAVHPADDYELASYYASMDIVVSTVWQKGFGYPPLETMACGSLSLATPMDYGNPMVDHIPIDVNNPRSIVEAVKLIFNCKVDAKNIIANGIKVASQYYWDNVVDKWVSCF